MPMSGAGGWRRKTSGQTARAPGANSMRKRLIADNPFADMKGVTVRSNRSRDYFITRADAAKVLDACPDAQWRLIFALSRFGGLPCPSETLSLRWADVDLAAGRMVVLS